MTKNVPATRAPAGAVAAYDYGEDAGAGLENRTADDIQIPFISILQGLSPQCETMDEAKPGKLINTVTNDIVPGDVGIPFVPVHIQKAVVEWIPRAQGGGIVGRHALDDDIVVRAKERAVEFGKWKTDEGNDLVETVYVYGLIPSEDMVSADFAVISFKSTGIKKYRNWRTRIDMIKVATKSGSKVTPPLFAHIWRLKTVKEKNKKGDFYNWDIRFDGANAEACRIAPDSELYQNAKAFREMIVEGRAVASEASEHADSAADAGTSTDPGEIPL